MGNSVSMKAVTKSFAYSARSAFYFLNVTAKSAKYAEGKEE